MQGHKELNGKGKNGKGKNNVEGKTTANKGNNGGKVEEKRNRRRTMCKKYGKDQKDEMGKGVKKYE